MLMQLMRFGAVGIGGSVTNVIVFSIAVKLLAINASIGATAAFLVALTQNFTINRLWTFRTVGRWPIGYAAGWTRYLVVNLVGFAVSLIVLNAFVEWAGPAYSVQGQVLGIVSGMAFNYVLSRLLVFRRDAATSRS